MIVLWYFKWEKTMVWDTTCITSKKNTRKDNIYWEQSPMIITTLHSEVENLNEMIIHKGVISNTSKVEIF